MDFINTLFLYALSAIALPILIHFLFRMRRRRVPFSSIRFILASTVHRTRRLRFREFLLLCMRIAIVALITLAFARPFLKRQRTDPISALGSKDVVLVVDDTLSMTCRAEGGTRFDTARTRALSALKGLGTGDRAAALFVSRRGQTSPIRLRPELDAVRTVLTAKGPTGAGGDVVAAVQSAARILRNSEADHRIVHVISDFHVSSAQGFQAAVARLSPGITVTADYLGGEAPNAAVLSVAPEPDSDGLTLAVKVGNFGAQPVRDLPVSLLIGDEEKTSRNVNMSSGEIVSVSLPCAGGVRADSHGHVEIASDDAIARDDRRYFVLSGRGAGRVLCLEDRIADVRYEQATYFVRAALDPFGAAMPLPNAYRAELRSLADLSRIDLAAFDAVLLANCQGLTQAQAGQLEAFVRQGGGVMIFAGPKVEPAVSNQWLFRDGLGLLPARFVRMRSAKREGQEFWNLSRWEQRHPITRPFLGAKADLLRTPAFRTIMAVDSTDRAEGRVLAHYDSGTPAILEKPFGLGRTLLCTWSADAAWTDFPKRIGFLPFMHAAMRYLCGTRPKRPTPTCGETVDLAWAWPSDANALLVHTPGGRTEKVMSASQRLDDTALPGVYRIETEDGKTIAEGEFAVNVDPAESDLTSIPQASIIEVLRERSETGPQTAAEKGDAEREEKPRIWRYLICAALALLLLELLYANRLGRG